MRTRTLATEGVALRLGFGKQRVAVVAHSSREPESVGGGGGNTLAELWSFNCQSYWRAEVSFLCFLFLMRNY